MVLPLPGATLSTLRCLVLLILSLFRVVVLIGSNASSTTGLDALPALHFDFILQNLLLPGYWELFSELERAEGLTPLLGLILPIVTLIWVCIPFMSVGGQQTLTEQHADEKRLKEPGEKLRIERLCIRFCLIDTLVLLMVQHA
jgi:hypothetical protein